jgi:hypothetical protein
MLAVATFCGFTPLVTTLISVACSQIEKVNTAIMDIRQQHITFQEDEYDNAIASCDLQAKINACIRHHQEIMA